MKYLFLIILYLSFFRAYTQENSIITRQDSLDNHARFTPKKVEGKIEALVNYLTQPCQSDEEKVRMLFIWTATHFTYNDVAYNSGKYPSQNALDVFKTRKGVCAGYSNFFKYICNLALIRCEKVDGYAKGYQYKARNKPDHSWNIVYLEKDTLLCDVTWGSSNGTTVNGKLKSQSRLNLFWLDTQKNIFIFSHLPTDNHFQYNTPQITKKEFDYLPKLESTFFSLIGNNDTLLKTLSVNKNLKLVNVLFVNTPIKGTNIPIESKLRINTSYQFTITAPLVKRVALIEDGKWTYIDSSNNSFEIIINTKASNIWISVQCSDDKYYRLLEYSTK